MIEDKGKLDALYTIWACWWKESAMEPNSNNVASGLDSYDFLITPT